MCIRDRRYDEAIAQFRKVLEIAPDFSSAHMGLWGAYYKKGMTDEALAEARKFFSVLHDHEVEEALVRGYAEGGYARAMHLGADVLAARSQRTHVPAVRIARLYAHAGAKEQALHWLQKACDERESPMTHLGVAWDWDFLRPDPRFQDLMRASAWRPDCLSEFASTARDYSRVAALHGNWPSSANPRIVVDTSPTGK